MICSISCFSALHHVRGGISNCPNLLALTAASKKRDAGCLHRLHNFTYAYNFRITEAINIYVILILLRNQFPKNWRHSLNHNFIEILLFVQQFKIKSCTQNTVSSLLFEKQLIFVIFQLECMCRKQHMPHHHPMRKEPPYLIFLRWPCSKLIRRQHFLLLLQLPGGSVCFLYAQHF